jgi:hypothetical protein
LRHARSPGGRADKLSSSSKSGDQVLSQTPLFAVVPPLCQLPSPRDGDVCVCVCVCTLAFLNLPAGHSIVVTLLRGNIHIYIYYTQQNDRIGTGSGCRALEVGRGGEGMERRLMLRWNLAPTAERLSVGAVL